MIKYDDLTAEQKHAYDTIIAGKNVFLTGDAGTGKSTVLDLVLAYFAEHGKTAVATAPTGIAAINIGGVTIHNLLKLKSSPFDKSVTQKSQEAFDQLFSNGGILVVDEISMCRLDLFEYLIRAMRNCESQNNCQIQIILVGDFFQLPPIVSRSEKQRYQASFSDRIYPFESPFWNNLMLTNIVLHQIVRQKATSKENLWFSQALNHIRFNDRFALNAVAYINQQCLTPLDPKSVYLCGRKKLATDINNRHLAQIDRPKIIFHAFHDKKMTKSYFPNDEDLALKIGVRVMAIKNVYEKGEDQPLVYNGQQGTLVNVTIDGHNLLNITHEQTADAPTAAKWKSMSTQEKEDFMADNNVTVRWDNGEVTFLSWQQWDAHKYTRKKSGEIVKEAVGSFIQMPFKLAYAMTIHKAQGQTLDSCNLMIKGGQIFTSGQLYVALSRTKDYKGLHLESKILPQAAKPNLKVSEFYTKIDPLMAQHEAVVDRQAALKDLGYAISKLNGKQIVQLTELVKRIF